MKDTVDAVKDTVHAVGARGRGTRPKFKSPNRLPAPPSRVPRIGRRRGLDTRPRMNGLLLDVFRVLTCNAVPPPRWLRTLAGFAVPGGAAPSEWDVMCSALRKAGQDHVLVPECPPEKRGAFLAQLRAIDLERLPELLHT
eukprot:872241-Prymnesium_polylepis.1